MANAYIETRIKITRVMLIILGVLIAALFTWGAIAVPEPGWYAALPMNALGIALVLVGSRRRVATQGESGSAVMSLGGLVIVASIFVSFALGNAS
ncbi:hypothetical protein GCM10009867_33500 [Pedococcus aerophilus]|uniref:Uncharacterized protein n=1 Tax=Pedococcus aerophilus TaxID=436356 RepID=A0ABP6HC56_9MICO